MQSDHLDKFTALLDATPRPIAQAVLHPAWSEAEDSLPDHATRPEIAEAALRKIPEQDGFKFGIANDGEGGRYSAEEVQDVLSRAGFEW